MPRKIFRTSWAWWFKRSQICVLFGFWFVNKLLRYNLITKLFTEKIKWQAEQIPRVFLPLDQIEGTKFISWHGKIKCPKGKSVMKVSVIINSYFKIIVACGIRPMHVDGTSQLYKVQIFFFFLKCTKYKYISLTIYVGNLICTFSFLKKK
jgi:hypothetical protein